MDVWKKHIRFWIVVDIYRYQIFLSVSRVVISLQKMDEKIAERIVDKIIKNLSDRDCLGINANNSSS